MGRLVDQRYRVLVVDDDRNALDTLEAALEDDLDVSLASSSEQALQLFDKGAFDVVCSDYQMGGMNGLELLELVTKKSPHTGCVLITGSSDFMSTRPQDNHYVLMKPFEPSRLIRMVLQLARVCAIKRSLADRPPSRTSPSSPRR